MLRRLIMLFQRFAPRPRPNPHIARYAVEQRQRRVAEKVAKVSGKSADAVLIDAYRRADRILANRR